MLFPVYLNTQTEMSSGSTGFSLFVLDAYNHSTMRVLDQLRFILFLIYTIAMHRHIILKLIDHFVLKNSITRSATNKKIIISTIKSKFYHVFFLQCYERLEYLWRSRSLILNKNLRIKALNSVLFTNARDSIWWPVKFYFYLKFCNYF